jgi:hypothetical protein
MKSMDGTTVQAIGAARKTTRKKEIFQNPSERLDFESERKSRGTAYFLR